ncbi:MAG: UDP-N-acetylmuramoyl-L-alanine--D-glutamate ligase, partial [Opitutales bacterium]
GSGLSGRAAQSLAHARGFEATLYDEADTGDSGSFDLHCLEKFDRFVFSPGFAAQHPWRQLVEDSGKRIQSELSFAAEFWKGRIIGVTGTNGKTTLTRFLAEALVSVGKLAVAAGNIGQPLSSLVLDTGNSNNAIAVCEISSFQAELTDGLELDALLWTNFAEDHLDRYNNMMDYFLAKASLLDCLRKDAICVFGPQVVQWFDHFSKPIGQAVVSVDGNKLLERLSPGSALSRRPFCENFTLTAEYWRLAGEPEDVLIEAANRFSLAPHRLDVVTEKNGVTYWNDSKSTNFHSTMAAVQAVPRPIYWIGGGKLKGGELDAFAEKLSEKIDAAIIYGEAAPPMSEALRNRLEIVQSIPVFEHAVAVATQLASANTPANVLLSPGFSSFDQFESYEARGKTFNSLVLGL